VLLLSTVVLSRLSFKCWKEQLAQRKKGRGREEEITLSQEEKVELEFDLATSGTNEASFSLVAHRFFNTRC
jgi:hypothetical protein